ncbi:hypothetical protein ACFXHA_05265 [Nocardia sp. NPDC059240]|uniref:hypothetical protein n=1 Tax=Nocardia sp. NPDC059240 TaxID=3346786 RepID=UPI0036A5F865
MTASPIRVTSLLNLMRLREDIVRNDGFAHWAGPHARLATELPNLVEYVQRQLSNTDHGYWPATPGVETSIDEELRMDGLLEVRATSTPAGLNAIVRMRSAYLEGREVFDRALGQLTGAGGGRWWPSRDGDSVRHQTVVLFRRNRSVNGIACRQFVDETLGRALYSAGALGLRTYALRTATKLELIPSSHRGPSSLGRYHAAIMIDTASRDHLMELLTAPAVSEVVAIQADTFSAAHAYTVDRSVDVIRDRKVVSLANQAS